MRGLIKDKRLLLITLGAIVMLLTTGCVQVEVSGIPTEHYLLLQTPEVNNTQLIDCVAATAADGQSTAELTCHPMTLTIHR
ncbi:MAG: hypothetical protein AAFQ61_12205 [Cyanobacteria bacterium J06626_23]